MFSREFVRCQNFLPTRIGGPVTHGSLSFCTLANIFSPTMDKTSAIDYLGLTWLTFRERTHAMERVVLKFRPTGVDLSSKSMAFSSITSFIIILALYVGDLSTTDIDNFKNDFVTTEAGTEYK